MPRQIFNHYSTGVPWEQTWDTFFVWNYGIFTPHSPPSFAAIPAGPMY